MESSKGFFVAQIWFSPKTRSSLQLRAQQATKFRWDHEQLSNPLRDSIESWSVGNDPFNGFL